MGVASVYVTSNPWAGSGYRMEIYGREGILVVTSEESPNHAVLAGIADAGVDPSPRVDADIRDCAADLHLGSMLHDFVLIVSKPNTLRHGSPPGVGNAISELKARRPLVS
jgi:hypothetical protein